MIYFGLFRSPRGEFQQFEVEQASNRLRQAMDTAFDCSGLLEAIDSAKRLGWTCRHEISMHVLNSILFLVGVATTEASTLLLNWQNHGRSQLTTAITSRNPDVLRTTLEETRAMGLTSLLEWKVREPKFLSRCLKSFLTGGTEAPCIT